MSQLENKTRAGNQADPDERTKGLDAEGKRALTSHNIKDEDGNLLPDPALVHKRWVLITKSPTLDPRLVNKVKLFGLRAYRSMTYTFDALRSSKQSGGWSTRKLYP